MRGKQRSVGCASSSLMIGETELDFAGVNQVVGGVKAAWFWGLEPYYPSRRFIY